ncbi:hypothetical protein ACWGPT_16820 [Pseudorhizobium sp. NPDC055634]
MMRFEIKGHLEDLQAGITGDAEIFGFSAEGLARRLAFIAEKYVIALDVHVASRTRGAVLNDIAYVANGDEAEIGRRAGILEGEALAAAFGAYPNAAVKLHGIDEYQDVYVPDSADLGVAAIKKMFAVRSRKNVPVLFKAEGLRTGLEEFWAEDRPTALERLQALAQAVPGLVKTALARAEALLKHTFQVGDGAEGRNQRVVVGVSQPADWQLMSEIFDVIWPIEKGQMHSSKMAHARNIIDQTIIYVRGEDERTKGGTRVGRTGLLSIGARDDDRDRRHLFSETWFSTILSYRHQINTLRQAVKFIEKRKQELQRIPVSGSSDQTVRLARLERLDRVAFYPLLDWRRELERRFREADYRTADVTVRRPTGGVFGLPDVPKLKTGMSQAQIAIRLIHAWQRYDSKREPPNKGKRKERPSKPNKAKADSQKRF